MRTAMIEYNNNAVIDGLLSVIAKMPEVRIKYIPVAIKKEEMSTEEFSRLSLSEKADYLDKSINKNVPEMTMEEIVQEVRDYRNGK